MDKKIQNEAHSTEICAKKTFYFWMSSTMIQVTWNDAFSFVSYIDKFSAYTSQENSWPSPENLDFRWFFELCLQYLSHRRFCRKRMNLKKSKTFLCFRSWQLFLSTIFDWNIKKSPIFYENLTCFPPKSPKIKPRLHHWAHRCKNWMTTNFCFGFRIGFIFDYILQNIFLCFLEYVWSLCQ